MIDDPHDLDRFVQTQRGVYEQALAELTRGRKTSHWMWFVFPQWTGLGASPTARRYAIRSRAEARAYLDHPTLGPRLRECAGVAAGLEGRTAGEVFGPPDDRKFRSSMTLFEAVAPDQPVFGRALERLCDGRQDPATLSALSATRD